MPTIIPNQDFKHGGQTFKKGERREVSEAEAYYFTMSGWVGEPSVAGGKETTLVVHDGEHGHESEVK